MTTTKMKRRENNILIDIVSLDVRTLKNKDILAFNDSKFAILGMSEVRRRNEEIIIRRDGNILCHGRKE